jgi:hypothetical protein
MTDDARQEIHRRLDFPAFVVNSFLDVECCQGFGNGEPDG